MLGIIAERCGSLASNGFPLTRSELLEIYFFHFALSSAYISSYPAVRALSPSLDVLRMIAASPEKRMTEEEIAKRFSDVGLVTARMDDLRKYRLITESGARVRLTFMSRIIVRSFIVYRRLLGLPIGQG